MPGSLLNAPDTDPAHSAADPLRAEVREVVQGLAKALRSYLLYEGSSPALDRFMDALRVRMSALWSQLPGITVSVDERELVWEGAPVFSAEERDSLAFLLYRDGVREITFQPGFEEAEVDALLVILAKVQRVRGELDDDLLTLLWDHDWTAFRYRYVEALPEGVQLPEASTSEPRPVAAPRAEVEAAPPPTISTDDFREALYFLDEPELARLAAELRRELARDLWVDVLNALFDRLQEGAPERQAQVLGVLGDVLPSLLGGARIDLAGRLLGELVAIATSNRLAPPVLRGVRQLFAQLADPEIVAELIRTVEEAGDAVGEEDLATLLAFFPPEALAPLLRAGETSGSTRVRTSVQAAAERLGDANREHLATLTADPDPRLAAGAARLLGRLRVAAAAPDVIRLLQRPEAELRLVAVEALQEMRSPTGAGALEATLDDGDREVRVAAARALAALRYAPAGAKLEAALDSKRLREADLTERIAFFEAYGGLAGPAGVTVLDKVLNGKSWLGRRETGEMRACAALGLGRIRHPNAEKALTAAAADADPVVRSAVGRALRGVRQ